MLIINLLPYLFCTEFDEDSRKGAETGAEGPADGPSTPERGRKGRGGSSGWTVDTGKGSSSIFVHIVLRVTDDFY